MKIRVVDVVAHDWEQIDKASRDAQEQRRQSWESGGDFLYALSLEAGVVRDDRASRGAGIDLRHSRPHVVAEAKAFASAVAFDHVVFFFVDLVGAAVPAILLG